MHDADPRLGHAEFAHGDAEDLCVEALPHLGAAVVHLHAAVAVDDDESPRLVQEARGKRDAEFHRRDGHPALHVGRRGVEGLHRRAPRRQLALVLQQRPQTSHPEVVDDLAVGRRPEDLAARWRIEISFPHDVAGQAEDLGHPGHGVFDEEHPLGAAEAAKRRVADDVGLADAAAQLDVLDVVTVVEVEQGPVVNALAQIKGEAGVGVDVSTQGGDEAGVVEADLKLPPKRVSLAGQGHVDVPVPHEAHRLLQTHGGQGHEGCGGIALGLFAAEAASHP